MMATKPSSRSSTTNTNTTYTNADTNNHNPTTATKSFAASLQHGPLIDPLTESSSSPLDPAWWPGGRTAQKALRFFPFTTLSTACVTAPAARLAAFRDPALPRHEFIEGFVRPWKVA